ncbi:MAG: hypothetical protein JXR68_01835 [Bacteroidales bacterium]|nr:hypothetical protein [Bacteroidales bacterium]
MKKLLTIILLLLFFIIGKSQNTQVRAFVDTNVIDFANQTILRLQVQTDASNEVFFPIFEDTITKNIEIVEQYDVKTINASPLILEKSFLITSFEDSLQTIPGLPIIVNSDTLFSNPVQLFVIPFYIDSAKVAQIDTNQVIPIFEIKLPLEAPFTFKEFWLRFGTYIIIFLILAIIIPLIIWLIKKYKSDEPIKILQKPLEPAHIIAFRSLKKLKEKQLHQKGNIKDYYSELTEIVRTYIEQRYRIKALERTSTEVLEDFEAAKLLNFELFGDLQKLLNLADLAKFAKYVPSIDVNNQNFDLVYKFVDNTKIEIKTEKQIDADNVSTQNITNID